MRMEKMHLSEQLLDERKMHLMREERTRRNDRLNCSNGCAEALLDTRYRILYPYSFQLDDRTILAKREGKKIEPKLREPFSPSNTLKRSEKNFVDIWFIFSSKE